MYKTPSEYCNRLHHVRPRFKGDKENVLLYLATEISKLPELPTKEFNNTLNSAIRLFPGNFNKTEKTINNWRTEISTLFGFIITKENKSAPGLRATELAENQDLLEFFKTFLFYFQYPGGHIKPHENRSIIEKGIKFKPAKYFLSLMKYAEEKEGKRIGFTKAELTHCVLNDLRCTRDNQTVEKTWELIKKNRENREVYDWRGDVIRYAGDLIDYMEIANLLKTYDNKNYYLNLLEIDTILKFIGSDCWFSGYDVMIANRNCGQVNLKELSFDWFNYVNQKIENTDFQTDILAFISEDVNQYEELKKASYDLLDEKFENSDKITTKDIGDIGEGLVHSHECERVKNGGRDYLVHLIKRIPTALAVGYDVLSVELDDKKRFIEVKTTISSKPLDFNKVHLTPNEWNMAETVRDSYYIYRLLISKNERKLFLIQDPVGKYKSDVLKMVPRNGAELVFDHTVGIFEELLVWKK